MTTTIDDLQQYVGKEVIVHLVQDDNSAKEFTGKIEAATVAGIVFKEKGKSGLQLIDSPAKIYEIDFAPVKQKPVTQKVLQPVEFGQARQHLVDRHGIELQWAKDADEKAAFEYHQGLDHSNLGHRHEKKDDKPKDEREQAIDSEAGQTTS